MIDDLSVEQFAEILHRNVSPTSPIQSQEHLFGRKRQLEQVQQALYAPGRSVFIHGDRGVGKTSLAQTVAYLHQSAKHNPVLLACEPNSSFEGIMTSALFQLGWRPATEFSVTRGVKVGYKGVGFDATNTRHESVIPQLQGASEINDVVATLLEVSSKRGSENVVVIDEFDRISSDQEKAEFADFIKQVGDQRIPIKFVFCGVAESLDTLLGAHASCYRYIESVELRTLSYEARFEIIDNIANSLHVVVDDRPRYRIAAISDGFPHYVHRMCEQLFWQMYNDPRPCKIPTLDHYRAAVVQSVLGIEQHLKQGYDRAVMKGARGYEHVLWSVADHSDLLRNTESIYSSYLRIVGSLGESVVLDRTTFVARLNSLKGKGCSGILSSSRKGWYQFRESIMRGYVRLRAEEQGCELALDYAAASRSDPGLSWRARHAKRGRIGTTSADRKKMEYPD